MHAYVLLLLSIPKCPTYWAVLMYYKHTNFNQYNVEQRMSLKLLKFTWEVVYYHKKKLWIFNALLDTFIKLWKATTRFIMSVRLHGTTQLPLDGFSRNLLFQDFLKICHENPSFIKIWYECQVLYMKMYVHL